MSVHPFDVIVAIILSVLAFSFFLGVPSIRAGIGTSTPPVLTGAGPLATVDNINYDGAGPTTISLYWAQSGDLCFSSYTLQYSTSGSNGPWTTLTTISTKSVTTQYAYGLTPTATYWWQVIDTDCVGSATSNVLQVAQPAVATLSYTQPTSTSASFTWTNNAIYGGLVSFASYQLMESVNGGSYSVAATITSESSMSYTINGLSTGTGYSFYLVTTDQCVSCSGGNSPSSSNTVTFGTAYPLSASVSVLPASADVGQLVSFSCAAAGGVAPYTYAWMFGDGMSGTGQNPSHAYTSPGTMNAVCTVTDTKSTTANSATTVTISPDPRINTPVAQPALIDVGQSVQFSTHASGGSDGYLYNWTGIPVGCGSADSNTISCIPTVGGTFLVAVSVKDSNGFTVISSPLSYLVNSDPEITTFVASPSSFNLGQTLALIVTASGGSAPLLYSYSGLPAGCTSLNAPALTCVPSVSGDFRVGVMVTDQVGMAVSDHVNITVVPTLLGLPQYQGYTLIGGSIILVAVASGAFIMFRRRKSRIA